ncbi:MAG: hypothetical protein R3F37_04180 [Candidatus Competibacteraceae bacterium]
MRSDCRGASGLDYSQSSPSSAATVWAAARGAAERRLIALSTDLTPHDRRVRIQLIQRLLRNGIPCSGDHSTD